MRQRLADIDTRAAITPAGVAVDPPDVVDEEVAAPIIG